MADDIVSDLRNLYATYGPMDKGMLAIWKAAAEIERLRAAGDALAQALAAYDEFKMETVLIAAWQEIRRG